MANYKELNKELVEQVQAMRVSLQEYQREIISLREKYMSSYESNLCLRKRCEDLALLHCQQYMQHLDLESSLLPFLQERLQLQGVPIMCVQRQDTETENSSVRQSERLTSEFRRSSTFSETKRSFNTKSPIRAPSCTVEEVDDGAVVETEVQSLLATLIPDIPKEEQLELFKFVK